MVKDSIECYGEVSDAFLQCSESVSTKVIWQENIEEEKSTLEYFEILSGDSKDNWDIDKSKIEEMLGDIKRELIFEGRTTLKWGILRVEDQSPCTSSFRQKRIFK